MFISMPQSNSGQLMKIVKRDSNMMQMDGSNHYMIQQQHVHLDQSNQVYGPDFVEMHDEVAFDDQNQPRYSADSDEEVKV